MPERVWDIIVVGGGTAGLPAAIFAAQRGAKVLVIEADDRLGGTLHLAQGQLSAAGTKVQKAKGIADTPDEHFADLVRISKNTIDHDLARFAVDNAADTFDWLTDHGFEMIPEHPVEGRAHEPYSKPRYYWGKDYGRSILKVLLAEIEPMIASGAVTVRLSTRVKELHAVDGAVRGVVVEAHNARETLLAHNVVLASGGYAANPEMYAALNGIPLYADVSYRTSKGDGITLGQAVGGYVRGGEKFLSNFGWILESDHFPSRTIGRADTYPARRPPWEIYVNSKGERFVAEDNPSVDAREHALLTQPGLRYWIVFDHAIFTAAPPLLLERTQAEIAAQFGNHPMFHRADSLDKLAVATGLPSAALERTVAAYNAGQAQHHDSLGRKHMPAPIGVPPFYAVVQFGASVSSTAGLAVNSSLQIIRRDGTAIPGLFAAGELLGGAQLMGNAFCGGMMGTPALTFGRLLGDKLLHWPT